MSLESDFRSKHEMTVDAVFCTAGERAQSFHVDEHKETEDGMSYAFLLAKIISYLALLLFLSGCLAGAPTSSFTYTKKSGIVKDDDKISTIEISCEIGGKEPMARESLIGHILSPAGAAGGTAATTGAGIATISAVGGITIAITHFLGHTLFREKFKKMPENDPLITPDIVAAYESCMKLLGMSE